MGDIKNIRVDNWGMFFLQRLQQFFNKTDYCDLTLQFHDNTQLKVHRLVLNACTEYFTILEQSCEMIDDCLVMPMDLQADVVVPIVNFMYTGQLEFKYSLLDRLQTTAQIMNMAILTKLLNAQKLQSPSAAKPVLLNRQNPIVPVTYNLQGRNIVPKLDNEYTIPSRKVWKKRSSAVSYCGDSNDMDALTFRMNKVKSTRTVDNSPRPTRFEASDVVTDNIFETSFDNISYESKPFSLAKAENNLTSVDSKASTSSCSFEELRKGYVQKRPAPQSPTSPESKRVNLQEVKEYVDEHRLRANYEMEENEDDPEDDPDQNNENDVYESEHDEDDLEPKIAMKQQNISTLQVSQNTRTEIQKTSVSVKESSVNHARIISEVLKKYPHLVKNNRNIKLKVVQQKSAPVKVTNDKKIVLGVSKEPIVNTNAKGIMNKQVSSSASVVISGKTDEPKVIDAKRMHALLALGAENTTGPWLCLRCGTNGRPISFPSYAIFRKHLVRIHEEKIDVRICEHCGHKSTKRNYLYFHLYTKHGVKPPSNIHFPKCTQCTYVALTEALLVKHKLNHSKLNEFVCNQCTAWFKTKQALIMHMTQTGHKIGPNTKESQQCIYCNKLFLREANMYAHVRTMHKDQARRDGIIEFSDDEEQQYDEADNETEESSDKYTPNNPQIEDHEGKIKILSNIALPAATSKEMQFIISPAGQSISKIGGRSQKTTRPQIVTTEGIILQNAIIQNLEPSSEAEALNNVATGIATSLGLVDSIVVMDNQYELGSQNIEEHEDHSQYIINPMQLEEIHNENVSDSLPDEQVITNHQTMHEQVQAEIQTGVTTTKIITQGDVLKLTESQQNEIINELQNSNHLTSRNNVVMVLTEDQYKHVKDNQIQNDDNIYVVYSQASQVDITEKQYMQIGDSEELIEDNTELSNAVEEGMEESIENNEETLDEDATVEQWPEETVEMISEELRKQISNDGILTPAPLMENNENNIESECESFKTEQLKQGNDCVDGLLNESPEDTSSLNETMETEQEEAVESHKMKEDLESKPSNKSAVVTNFNEEWSEEEELSKDEDVNTELKNTQFATNNEDSKDLSNEQGLCETIQNEENSEDAAVQACSQTPTVQDAKINSTKSTENNKITKLLDDWEDNDSHEEIKTNENAEEPETQRVMTSDQINKLMDDWTEEDAAMEI